MASTEHKLALTGLLAIVVCSATLVKLPRATAAPVASLGASIHPTSQNRHIYNNSNKVWTIAIYQGDGYNKGNVYFNDAACGAYTGIPASNPRYYPQVAGAPTPQTRRITSHGPAVLPGSNGNTTPIKITDNTPNNVRQTGGTALNGPYNLGPGCSVEIQYTTTNGVSQGYWQVTDTKGVKRQFSYGTIGGNTHINPGGNTGPVQFNEPADGDITLSGDTW